MHINLSVCAPPEVQNLRLGNPSLLQQAENHPASRFGQQSLQAHSRGIFP